MLIRGSILTRKARGPQSGIDFSDGGAAGRNLPTVERPKVDTLAEALADEP